MSFVSISKADLVMEILASSGSTSVSYISSVKINISSLGLNFSLLHCMTLSNWPTNLCRIDLRKE